LELPFQHQHQQFGAGVANRNVSNQIRVVDQFGPGILPSNQLPYFNNGFEQQQQRQQPTFVGVAPNQQQQQQQQQQHHWQQSSIQPLQQYSVPTAGRGDHQQQNLGLSTEDGSSSKTVTPRNPKYLLTGMFNTWATLDLGARQPAVELESTD
jgi:hypothetical protein